MAKQDESRALERTPSTDFETESLPPPRYTETYDHSYEPNHDPETVIASPEEPYHIRGKHTAPKIEIRKTDSRSIR